MTDQLPLPSKNSWLPLLPPAEGRSPVSGRAVSISPNEEDASPTAKTGSVSSHGEETPWEKPAWLIAAEACTPCVVCGCNGERQKVSQYTSHIKYFYNAGQRAVWSIGNSLILKERDIALSNNEVENSALVASETTIPIPTFVGEWREDTHFMIMNRIPGDTLETLWPSLSPEEKDNIARQTADCLQQLRARQSPRMEAIHGKPLCSSFLFEGSGDQPHGPFDSDDAFWNKLELRIAHIPEQVRLNLRREMPSCQPYTFSHTDLAVCNVMARDGNLAAIIDWEMGAFFPVWWEYVKAGWSWSPDDCEWKRLLRGYMEPHREADRFWRKLEALADPEADNHAAVLEQLSSAVEADGHQDAAEAMSLNGDRIERTSPAGDLSAEESDRDSGDDSGEGSEDASDEDTSDSDSSAEEVPEEKPDWLLAEEAATPCGACYFNPARLKHCDYKSDIRLFYTSDDRGVWSIGDRLILKQRGLKEGVTHEVENARFITESTSIPVPTIVDAWRENDQDFVLMKRLPGVNLHEAWPKMSDPERYRIGQQTLEYLKQLRGLRSERMEYLNGMPGAVFTSQSEHPISSDEEFWNHIKTLLKHVNLPENALEKLRDRMPACEPWTFTHLDLTDVNIMVHEGNVSGIIDWEHGGYFPVWWEYAQTQLQHSDEDTDWKGLLRHLMEPQEAGAKFWRDVWRLKYHYQDVNAEKAKELIAELMA